MTLYEVLGVKGSATPDEIKAAYRGLSKQHHPDKGGDPLVFSSITKAYDILMDHDRRTRYDTTGEFEDKPDPIETAARAQFFAMCEELFFKAANINFTENLKEFRKQSQAHIDKQRRENTQQRELAEAARERIKRSPADNDLLTGLIQQKLDVCTATETKLDEAQKIFDRAYELWADYDIDDTNAPSRGYMQTGMMVAQWPGTTASGTSY